MTSLQADGGGLAALALGAVADYPHPSSPGRSANMRANRRTDTKPELALRRALHSRGYRYRKDYRLDLDGGTRVRPDIAFTARRVAVFVDGCFWHSCPQHGSKPAVNVGYWDPKLRRNVERDRAADTALGAAGRGLGSRPHLGTRVAGGRGGRRARRPGRRQQPLTAPAGG